MSESSSDAPCSAMNKQCCETDKESPCQEHGLDNEIRQQLTEAQDGAVRIDQQSFDDWHHDEERRLTLEDCVDMDVDVLSTTLEKSFQSFKRETLDFFVDARSRFKKRALSELNQERGISQRKENSKNEEISLLECDLKNERRRNERLLDSLSRMAGAIGNANQRKRNYRLLLVVYYSWLEFAKFERSLKSKQEKASRYYCHEKLTRKPFVRWIDFVREQHRSCSKERFQAKLAIARNALETEFNAKLEVIKNENLELKEKLKKESEARSKLEEDMQQAFMRGVCALNMEALSVMKRGMPPNGNNPFFASKETSECSGNRDKSQDATAV